MPGTILRCRNSTTLALSLCIVGCSGSTQPIALGQGNQSPDASGGSIDQGEGGATPGSTPSGANREPDEGGFSGSGGDATGEPEAGRSQDAMSNSNGGADSAPTPNPGSPPGSMVDAGGDGGDSLAASRVQCVQVINQYRATLNPPSAPLQEAFAEEGCVDGQAQADYHANTAHSAFGQCKERAQDECPGWPGPPSAIDTKCLAQMWAEGPPPAGKDNHWLNMSNAKYTRVACGFYQTPSGRWWATQDFY